LNIILNIQSIPDAHHSLIALLVIIDKSTRMVDLHNKVSNGAIEAFEKNDVELSVPDGAPTPVLIIVMVSLLSGRADDVDSRRSWGGLPLGLAQAGLSSARCRKCEADAQGPASWYVTGQHPDDREREERGCV
jgi:hypothetical protein